MSNVCVEAGELKFYMNMLQCECFKVCFSDFDVLDICGGFLEKIADLLVCNKWKVDTRPTSSSISIHPTVLYMGCFKINQLSLSVPKI
jgi:hypothetical protein